MTEFEIAMEKSEEARKSFRQKIEESKARIKEMEIENMEQLERINKWEYKITTKEQQ